MAVDKGQLMQSQLNDIRKRHSDLNSRVLPEYWRFSASQAEKDRRDLLGHIEALEAKLRRARPDTVA